MISIEHSVPELVLGGPERDHCRILYGLGWLLSINTCTQYSYSLFSEQRPWPMTMKTDKRKDTVLSVILLSNLYVLYVMYSIIRYSDFQQPQSTEGDLAYSRRTIAFRQTSSSSIDSMITVPILMFLATGCKMNDRSRIMKCVVP